MPAARRPRAAKRAKAATPRLAPVAPMLATVGEEAPGEGWAYEPKYDGVRVIAVVSPTAVRLITRNRRDKAAQFPEIAEALQRVARRRGRTFMVDGEIVGFVEGRPARFQHLQSRMHVLDVGAIAEHRKDSPAAFVMFDLLAYDGESLWRLPWTERRARLERYLAGVQDTHLLLSDVVRDANDPRGEQLLRDARRQGWEGIIAKDMAAPYQPGVRSTVWRKLKIEFRQEFVVGGYTEPRRSRPYLGALLLGYYDGDTLVYAGHAGGGFTHRGLREMRNRLAPLERKKSPFHPVPRTNERAHWVQPSVVVEVKFNEWTDDGLLRQPIVLGVRDDKNPRHVKREAESVQHAAEASSSPPGTPMPSSRSTSRKTSNTKKKTATKPARRVVAHAMTPSSTASESVIRQLDALEEAGEDGTIRISRGRSVEVSSLGKTFFPREGYTKGDLMCYYARVAPFILPVMKDRPLVLKRFPNGIGGESFFQQNAGSHVPKGIRVETIHPEDTDQDRIVGGDLETLLYTVQLGAISVDPWHARVQTLQEADYAIIDLDPGDDAPFRRVVDTARWVRDVLDEWGIHGALKTSGASGLHIYLPLGPGVSNETALMLAQVVSEQVAQQHPKETTVVRAVRSRASSSVYVDAFQNVLGKSVAGAYCVRARPGATVSTPLTWDELTDALDPRDFTIETIPARLAERGDIWKEAMRRKNTRRSLSRITRAAK